MTAKLAGRIALAVVGFLLLLILLAWLPLPDRPDSRASVSLIIEQPQYAVWEVISDLAHGDNYVSDLQSISLQPGIATGVGATRRVLASDGRELDETVTQWQEGEGFTLRLHNGERAPFPFDQASFEYRLDAMSAEATAVHLSLVYRPRYGVLGQFLNDLVLASAVEKQVMGVASGLKRYCDEQASSRTY